MYNSSMNLNPLKQNIDKINTWLEDREKSEILPLYSSVDIRDAGFKMAVVDTNLFPAGFNNICELARTNIAPQLRDIILHRNPDCSCILLTIEEHTRNTWYLENIFTLKEMIVKAGFEVKIASFLNDEPEFCEEKGVLSLETAKGNTVDVHCLSAMIDSVCCGKKTFDLIILNNDLTTGIPDALRETNIPIYPSLAAGWHSRSKSHHFKEANALIQEFSELAQVDPWLLSCLFKHVETVDINSESDRDRLLEAATELFSEIESKYAEHGITEKPFIFLKADSGTYGMGVMAIESPEDILSLNRKARNKLSKGKSSQQITDFILQEGVPTAQNVNNKVSEVCIYQITNHFLGGFYRLNSQKSSRDNLNSTGMSFQKICTGSTWDCSKNEENECQVENNEGDLIIYKLLARLACLAAHKEVLQLETQQQL